MEIENWQAIIFDFDGVIVESGKIKAQAFAELYRPYGDDIATRAVNYHQQNGGKSRYEKFRYFQQHLLGRPPLTPEEEHELDLSFSKLVVQAVINCDPVPGAIELIEHLWPKTPLFLASGTPEAELRTIVKARKLEPYFLDVRGAPTPKHQLVAEILLNHAIKPESTLMVGDALVDYESAQANNIAFIARVHPEEKNLFPSNIRTIPDLSMLTR